ncbi:universal stress protein [bacterium]|nr:MAG: universal stress protein [bacterium]
MKILLAIDGSEYSEGAAKFLRNLQLTAEDEISILHVVGWVPILNEWESLFPDFQYIRQGVVPKILESAENILKNGKAKVSGTFLEGFPDKEIVETAKETGIDLVVMGSRGIRGIGSYIVGSTTRLVAIHSPRPVLIIKPPQWERKENMRILFATDGSVHSEAAAEVLTSIPFPQDTEVTIMNIIFSPFEDIPERFAIEINEKMKMKVADMRTKEFKESDATLERARQLLSSSFSKVDVMSRIGNPSDEILKAAEILKADIITVGSSGMRGIKGMLGSISRNILNQASCSVLVGKK